MKPSTYRRLGPQEPLAPLYYGWDITPTEVPFTSMIAEGSSGAHLPVRTPPEPTPRDFLSDWKVI